MNCNDLKASMRSFFAASALSAATVAALAANATTGVATDGFCWATAWWAPAFNPLSTSSPYWEGGVVPHDGGVGYFTGTSLPNINFGGDTLRGLDFGNVQFVSGRNLPTLGGTLTLTGDAFIAGTGNGGTIANVSGTVSGTGDNPVTKKGYGTLVLSTPLSNFATVAAGGGTLQASTTSGTLFSSSGTQAVRGGFFSWTPESAASASMRPVAYGPRGGGIKVSAASGTTATLAIPSLTPEADGGTLWIRAAGGTNALGATEKFLVTTPPTLVNGMLDPGIVTHDETTESWPVLFTTYDSSNGIVPYPASSMVDLSSATATDVAVVKADTTLSASKQVAALVVDDTASLSIGSGATLTVGDNNASHPAGVIFNHNVNRGANTAMTFSGGGTLDFGASPGVIWTSMPTKDGWGPNRSVEITAKITGQNGMTFATHDRSATTTAGYFRFGSGVAQWSGPTRIEGGFLWIDAEDALPAGDIYVLGGAGGRGGGQFRPNAGGWNFSQNFFLAGAGPYGDDECAFYLQNGNTTLNGVVTLVDDTVFLGGPAKNVRFAQGVRGPGSLILNGGGDIAFGGVNTFDALVLNNSTTVRFRNGSTFGAGRVWMKGGDHILTFDRQCAIASTNEFRLEAGSLSMSLDNATLSFTKPATVAALALTNFSAVAIGGEWEVAKISGYGARDATLGNERITAADGGATLALGDASDAVLATAIADGDGALGLAKQGAGTLELPADDIRAYTGATTVREGTLKLNDDPLLSSSLLYWFDASREEDFTKNADTGVISAWHSRGGKLNATFATANGTPTWGTAAKVNGHDVVTTKKAEGAVADQLVAGTSAPHRTVFVVCRANSSASNVGLIGKNGADIGHRMTSPQYWQPESGSWTLNTTGAIRIDGEESTKPAINVGSTRILTLVHDRDGWENSVGASWAGNTVSCDFTPAIGWYYSQRNFDGDYCEILAFDRVLSEHEKRVMENYLSEKWLGRTLWSDTLAAQPIPAASALRVETGATLDLAGVSLSVASLTGNGTITNSSATAATLSVTGAADFTGRIAGPVTIATTGSASLGAVVGAGATLAAQGGTLAAGTHLLTPPTAGLAYWCDAAARDTILEQAGVGVTGWVSRAASSSPGLVLRDSAPAYSASGLGGKPAIQFSTTSSLMTKTTSPVRTVFIVAALSGAQSGNGGLWGISGLDRGFRFGNNTTKLEGDGGHVRPTIPGNRVCLDGVTDGGQDIEFGTAVHVFSARMEGVEEHFHNIGLSTPAARGTVVGKYCQNSSFTGWVGEVIAYDRVLTDGEMKQVEAYLAAKWQDATWTEGNPPAEAEDGFETGATLAVGSGANVDFGSASVTVGTLRNDGTGGSLTGNVTIGDEFVVDATGCSSISPVAVNGNVAIGSSATATILGVGYLERGRRHDALTATGTLTGDFATVNGLTGVWRTGKSANAWYLDVSPFVMVVR